MSELQDDLFDLIHAEIAAAQEQMRAGMARQEEAQALKEILLDVLVVRPSVDDNGNEEEIDLTDHIEFRRMVLASLEEQTPHSAREVAQRLDLPTDAVTRRRVLRQINVLLKADRVRFAGARVEGSGHPSNFYVRVPLNGSDSAPVEQMVTVES